MFRPHSFKTSVYGVPTVYIALQAFVDMAIIVQEVQTEVGWLCSVKHIDKSNDLFLDKIYLPKQEVHSTTTELTPAGLADLATEIITKDPKNGPDEVNNIRGWFHSHSTMDVMPSGQDNEQMGLFKTQADWFLRGIVNKAGKMKLDLYYYRFGADGLVFEDVQWRLAEEAADEVRRTFWRDTIKDRVGSLTFETGGTGLGSRSMGVNLGNGPLTGPHDVRGPTGSERTWEVGTQGLGGD